MTFHVGLKVALCHLCHILERTAQHQTKGEHAFSAAEICNIGPCSISLSNVGHKIAQRDTRGVLFKALAVGRVQGWIQALKASQHLASVAGEDDSGGKFQLSDT